MAKVRFGEVIREAKEKVDRSNNPYEFYVAGDHMDTEDLLIRRKGRFATDDVGPAFIRVFHEGQVLYGSRRTYLKKIAVADFDGVTANTTFVLETKDENILRQRLIPFIMYTEKFTEWSVKKSKGSTNPYVLFSDLADYEFDLPSMGKQDELVELLWSMVEAKEAYQELLRQTDELVKARFIEMFGDPETVIKTAKHTVADVADVQVGLVIKPTRFYSDNGTGTPAFRSLNVGPMRVIDSDWVYFTDKGMQENIRTVAHTGDVLVVRSGYPGTSCVVTPEFDGRNVVDLLIAHPKTNLVLPEFLCAYTNFPHGKIQIENMQRGVAQKHFNVAFYNRMKIVVPTLEKQQEFIRFLYQSDKSKLELEQATKALKAVCDKIISENLS